MIHIHQLECLDDALLMQIVFHPSTYILRRCIHRGTEDYKAELLPSASGYCVQLVKCGCMRLKSRLDVPVLRYSRCSPEILMYRMLFRYYLFAHYCLVTVQSIAASCVMNCILQRVLAEQAAEIEVMDHV